MARTPYFGVGINKYAGKGNSLSVCVADTTMFASLFGAKPTLLDKQATREKITRMLPDWASQSHESSSGMWSVGHYSGHGSNQFSDKSEELDGTDEMIVTTELDGIRDKEWPALLAPRNTLKRMLWVSDSCFAHGQYRALSLGLESAEIPRGRARYLAPSKVVIGRLPAPIPDVAPSEIDGPIYKNVVFFAACANFEYAWEGSKNGVWTAALIQTYDPTLTIKGWFARAVRVVASGPFGKRQHPQLICSREAMSWGSAHPMMRRRQSLRESDGESDDLYVIHKWSKLQWIAVVLQTVEVLAVVALAGIAFTLSSSLNHSQDRIVQAIESLHREVQKTEATK